MQKKTLHVRISPLLRLYTDLVCSLRSQFRISIVENFYYIQNGYHPIILPVVVTQSQGDVDEHDQIRDDNSVDVS